MSIIEKPRVAREKTVADLYTALRTILGGAKNYQPRTALVYVVRPAQDFDLLEICSTILRRFMV